MYRKRRTILVIGFLIFLSFLISINSQQAQSQTINNHLSRKTSGISAMVTLNEIPIKESGPRSSYSRDQFGSGWTTKSGCDTRNIILNRDLMNAVVNEKCEVTSGVLNDPYTGKVIKFVRGSSTSGAIQIDHVVALSDAWQKGASYLTKDERVALANDPLELLAVDGSMNEQKSDGDAATWLPPNKLFRCEYVARQIAVKKKYKLWINLAEHDAITMILSSCVGQMLPSP